jgi:hypothetical protein
MSDTPKPPGLHPLAWEYLCAVREVQQADDEITLAYSDHLCGVQRRAEDAWAAEGCPLLDDGDLPVDETPEPPPADAALLAMANRALGEQLDEARAEVERLRSQLRGVGVEEYLAAKAEVWRLREEVERLRNNEVALIDAHNDRVAWLSAEVERLRDERDDERARNQARAEAVRLRERERDEARAEVIELRAQRPDQIEYRVHRDVVLAAATDGAAVERARIVAWLRTEADKVSTRNRPAGLLASAADAIEAGEHEGGAG